MKKGATILLLGLLLATAAFCGFYYLGTASCRRMMRGPQPELAWLNSHLADCSDCAGFAADFDGAQRQKRSLSAFAQIPM